MKRKSNKINNRLKLNKLNYKKTKTVKSTKYTNKTNKIETIKRLSKYKLNGGGDIVSIQFKNVDDRDLVISDESLGYDNLNSILYNNIKCTVQWKDKDIVQNINFAIDISKELGHSERIPKKPVYGLNPDDNTNLFVKISNIKDGKKNDIGELCLWLIASKNLTIPVEPALSENDKKGLIYLGYIRSEGKNCFTPFIKVPQGLIIMKILIQFSKLLKFTKIILLDQANKNCVVNEGENNLFNQDRNLRNRYLLQTGNTYYGTFGFRPIKEDDSRIYNLINKLLSTPIIDLFNKETIIKYMPTESNNDNVDLSRLINEYSTKYVTSLNTSIANPELQNQPYFKFNDAFIKSDCLYEKIIYDLLFSDNSLFNFVNENIKPLMSELYTQKELEDLSSSSLKTSKFENMMLIL
jgi:hypothetical protein